MHVFTVQAQLLVVFAEYSPISCVSSPHICKDAIARSLFPTVTFVALLCVLGSSVRSLPVNGSLNFM